MNEKIIANHNSIVKPDDEVYFLGDICMGKIAQAPELIRRLNGVKYLVKGNHDKTLHKLILGDSNFSDLFVWIRDYHEASYKFDGKKHSICMMHFPIKFWNFMNQGGLSAHGHLHGSPSGIDGRSGDVGIDTNNLYPYQMDEFVGKMLKIGHIGNHH